nr:proline-, glutamic acid- and leucine-rich protein 1-like [Taeniopygia guttata]
MDREISWREDVEETHQREVPGAQEMSGQGTRSSQELYQGQSPTEAEPAAAAPAGAAEEEEEPGWAVLALAGPVQSQHWSLEALAPDSDWDSDSEEESPVPAPHSTPSPSSAPLGAQAPWEEPEWAVLALAGPVLSQHWSLEALAPDSDWSSDSEEEEGEVEPELSQGTVSLIQELSQEEDDVSSSSGEKPVGPVKEGDTQPSPPEGPSSASPVGTEVAAEAAPALPSASPLPGSPTEAEPAAAAPSGAAEEAAAGSGLAVQERTDDDDDDEMKFWQYLDDLAPFLVGDPELSQEASYYEQYREEDLPHGVVMSYHQLFDWEKYLEQDLSQGEVSSSQGPSDWEEYPEQVLCGGDVISCEELSDWEEHLGQKVSRGNGSRPSGLSSWGDDSDTGLVQENWPEHVILAKPLCPEDDEWDDVSLLELPPEDKKDQKRKVLVAEGLPVPVPREAWAECPAQEPCSQGPAPAPHSPPSPWPARLGAQALRGQPAAPRKRPSRFRRALRALRGLFRCPCLRPRTEE